MNGLTPQQAQLLDFIRSYQRENGASPSFAEMVAGCAIPSKSSIHRLLAQLEARGAITSRTINRYRSITVTDDIPCLSALRGLSDHAFEDLRRRVEAVSFERSRDAGTARATAILEAR